ncbi:unnamed protein product [Prunus brigantina]
MRRNAVDEDGRLWYEECISARFIRPVKEAVRVALKNADWDPLLPKAVTGARKTLAHRTVPSTSPARPVAAVVPGCKRGREALYTETVVAEAFPAESVVVETASSERLRKKVLLDLLEDEDEEDAPSAVEEETAAEPGAEEAAAVEAMIEAAAAEVVVEEEATTEVVETLDAEVAAAEAPAAEEVVEDISDDEASAIGSPQAAQVDVALAASAEHTSVVTMPTLPLPMPPVPSPQESVAVTALAVVEAAVTDAPSPPPVSSAETTSPDDLEELYASLHEEGSSSASAPLDEDSKAVIERLREFLLCDAYQMTTTEAFMEFSSCLDTAMAMGLLDSA